MGLLDRAERTLDTGGRNAACRTELRSMDVAMALRRSGKYAVVPAASAPNRIDSVSSVRLTRGASSSPTVVVLTVITGTPSTL